MSNQTIAYIGEAVAQEGEFLCQLARAAAALRMGLHVWPDSASGLAFLAQSAAPPAAVVLPPGTLRPTLARQVHRLASSTLIVCLGGPPTPLPKHIPHVVIDRADISALLLSALTDARRVSTMRIGDQASRYVPLVSVQVDEAAAVQRIVDAVPALVAYVDRDQCLRYVSRRYDTWFGAPAAAVYGRHFREAFGDGFYESARLCLEAALQGEEATYEAIQCCADRARKVYTAIIPDRDADGSVRGVICVFQDVSEQRGLEQHHLQSQKLESLATLTAQLSHDFNELLTVILGNVSLAALRANEDPCLSASLGDAQDAVERARRLTQQLLMFARGPEPVRAPGGIVPLLHETAAAALRDSPVRMEFAIPDDLAFVDFDAKLLGDAFTNIMLNAVQAMPLGGTLRVVARNVSLAGERGSAGRPYVKVSIIDTGVGISEEHVSRIFDPYFTTKRCGSGLGLATAYAVVRQHEGVIDVSSKVGKGTCVCVYLPITVAVGTGIGEGGWRRRDGGGLRLPLCDGLIHTDLGLSRGRAGGELQEGM